MPEQRPLDLGRVGVEAADDEHVLQPVGDGDVPVVVHDADVAGVEPALGVDGLGRGLGVLEVAGHHRVAPDEDLPRAAPAGSSAPAASTIRTSVSGMARPEVWEMTSGGSPPAAHGDHPGGLGQAVGGEDGGEGELGPHPADELDGDGRRPGHRQPERGEVVVGPRPGVVEDGLVERGGAREHGDPLGRH